MKYLLDIDDDLHSHFKRLCKLRKMDMKKVISDLIREELEKDYQKRKKEGFLIRLHR